MKRVLIASLVAAQLSSTPASAASLEDYSANGPSRAGTFAGARVRIGFGGEGHGKARAGLTLAPVHRGQVANGIRTRFGEGLELGVVGGGPLALRAGGVPLDGRLAAQEDVSSEDKDSTGEKVLKGLAIAGLVAGAVVGGLFLFLTIHCDDGRCSE